MSLFSSAIIDDIRIMSEAGLASMAYFYFDFRDIHKQSRRDMISSLLFQLSTQSIRFHEILYRLYLAHHNGAQRLSDGILTKCLKDMLSIPSKVPIYIIMDAIDECPDTSQDTSGMSPREEILDLVEELVDLRLPNLRLCVTSRPEIDIRVALEPLSSLQVSLHDETGQKQDIANYIRDFIASDQGMRRWRGEEDKEVIHVLTLRNHGVSGSHYASISVAHVLSRFLWVSCQLETLRYCLPSSVRPVLDELPETLDDTYERILRDIIKPKRDHVRRLLQCLAVAIRPLRVEELAEVFRRAANFDNEGATPIRNINWRWEDQEQAVLSACSRFVKVVNVGGSKMVKLSHFSVKAFLTSERLATSSGDGWHYHILPKPAHTILARACLNVLLRLEGHLDLDSIKQSPLVEYAAKHWVDHARFENVTSHIQEGMELLFDPENPHFANWVSIYDMDESLGPPTPPHPTRPNAAPLYYAALCGLPSLVKWLIVKHHMDVNSRGGHYVTAIRAALYKRHLSIVRLLIDHGVDVNTQDDDGSNLLQIAAQIGDPEAVSLLLSLGAGVQETDSNYSSLLFMMLNNGNLTETRLLLDHGVDANALDEKQATALHISSSNGDVEFVEVLFQYGADVDPRDNNGSTPLHLASAKGNRAAVGLLMEHRADVNALDNTNSTPLHRAFANQNLDIAALLIEKGADVKVLDDKTLTPLHLALSNGNAKLVKQLIQRGVDVNGRDKNNLTPLHFASAKGDSMAIELLINENVDLDVVDNAKSTPLHLSLINGNLDVAKLLVEKGADVNVSDNKKRIPLHLVLPNKNVGLVNLLVQRGADVNIRGNDNSTPLHVASRHGPCESVDLLLEHRGDPNVRDDSGSSPLHIASQRGAIDIAENLLKGGAKVNLKDGNRKTPLHLASNNKKMARLLIRYGADAFALDKDEDMPLQYGNKQSRTLRG
jgi:ankyrin repeat protein